MKILFNEVWGHKSTYSGHVDQTHIKRLKVIKGSTIYEAQSSTTPALKNKLIKIILGHNRYITAANALESHVYDATVLGFADRYGAIFNYHNGENN